MAEDTETIEQKSQTADTSTQTDQATKPGDLIDTTEISKPKPDDTYLKDVYLPPEIRDDPTMKNMADGTVADMAQMMIDGQKLLGADRFTVPGKDADEKEWTDIYKKLGRPDTVGEYSLKMVDEMPEGIVNKERVSEYGDLAFRLGLSAKQANALFQWNQEKTLVDLASIDSAKSQKLEAGIGELKNELGNAYEEKCRGANSVIRNTPGGEEFREALKEGGLGNDPRVIRWLANSIAPIIGEDRLLGLDAGRAPSGVNTPDQAKAKITVLRSQPGWGDKYHADFAKISAEYDKLVIDAYPEDRTA